MAVPFPRESQSDDRPAALIFENEETTVNGSNTNAQPIPLPVRRALFDFSLVFGAVIGYEIILRLIGPRHRGFYCEDESIRYPLQESTVPNSALFIYAFSITSLFIIITEFLRLNCKLHSQEYYSVLEVGRTKLQRLLLRFVIFFGNFGVVMGVTAIVTNSTKFPVGRLRPYFLDVCRPKNMSLDDCSAFNYRYITEFECDWKIPALSEESRLSFFSGHSSFALCAATFVVYYVESRLKDVLVPLLGQTLFIFSQSAALCSGLFIAYTRVADNMHHPTDVLVGILVGMSTATLVVFHHARFYQRTSAFRRSLPKQFSGVLAS